MTKSKLYTLLLIACFSGFIYLILTIYFAQSNLYGVCIIKNVTGIPCPSCGTTRAVQLLLQGSILESLQANPFGVLVAVIMFFVPFWIAFDLISKKETFYIAYKKMEATIKTHWLAAILIFLVLLNWIWNIYKQL
jgi:hypothetical protein